MILRVVVFYLLTLFFTFLIGGLQQEAGLLTGLTFLPQWGPGIAGLLTMLIFLRRDRVRITFFSPGMPLRRYLWAFLLPHHKLFACRGDQSTSSTPTRSFLCRRRTSSSAA